MLYSGGFERCISAGMGAVAAVPAVEDHLPGWTEGGGEGSMVVARRKGGGGYDRLIWRRSSGEETINRTQR
ncbi:putative formin-like protein 6 isoform X2 [Iris pallida]|uniref:Formin-like protein 6 isoform X2 n=1 Tax=Iris pallida TaxID=29817 RepID=A0AAX6I6Y3_IRIPA|nr:putative formin-like protein 6 isoform X2 [Iris pallida]